LDGNDELFVGEDMHPDGNHMAPSDATTPKVTVVKHPQLDGTSSLYVGSPTYHGSFLFYLGTPVTPDGLDLPPNTKPPSRPTHENCDWYLYDNRAEFEFADFLYREDQMSAGKINKLSHILAALYPDDLPTFADNKDLYNTIDAMEVGDVPWDSFTVTYNLRVKCRVG